MIRTDKEFRDNLRQIRRLHKRIVEGKLGRNAGATFSAYDRRVAEDRAYVMREVDAGRTDCLSVDEENVYEPADTTDRLRFDHGDGPLPIEDAS